MFRVDDDEVVGSGCRFNYSGVRVAADPAFVSIYGHEAVRFTGPCVDAVEGAVPTCTFKARNI